MGFMQNLPELLPVVVIVHDAWHTPSHYSSFIDNLSALGYPIACPQLLTAHTEPNCTSSFHDDVSLIYQLAFDLCSDGNDVIVLGHGYGAFVASEAVGELGKNERQRLGKVGGAIGFIALAGLLPEQGQKFEDVFGGGFPEYIRHQDSTLILLEPDTFLYNDLGPMTREHWTSHLIRFTAKPSDIVCHSTPAWKTIPTTYIICEDDHFIPESLQREIATRAGAQILEMEDVGHDAFIGKSEELVDVVGGIVAKLYLVDVAAEQKHGWDVSHKDSKSNQTTPGCAGDEEDPMQKPLRRTTTAP